MMPRRRLLSAPEFFTLAALAATACGGASTGGHAPEASVAASAAAQHEFREIHRRWTASRPSERGRLEPLLRAFVERHPDDGRARVARVYLAFLYVQRGRVHEARALVKQVRSGPSGATRDFAAVVEAAILLREGKADQALSVLLPLEGKIIDPDERFLFGEQRVTAALGARRPASALRAMRDWLAETAPEERDAVRGRVLELIRQVAPEPLFRTFTELASEKGAVNANPDRERARDFMLPLIAERLTDVAIERSDGQLARDLLDTGLPWFRRGKRGQELALIAASGSVLPRIVGRSLGLVLSVGTLDQRRRSAEVVAGVARALGLPASAADGEAVQLFTSEDDGSTHGVPRALAELAGEGAAILIAGVDPTTAAAAAKYSANTGIPVLLLAHAPGAGGQERVVGETLEREAEALGAGARALTLDRPVEVGSRGVACDVEPSAAGQPRFPVQTWKRDRIDGVLVSGNAACARDVARESQETGRRVTLGLGLEAGELFDQLEPAQPRFAVSAGAFPHRKGTPAPESLERLVARSGHAPSWFTTLGHDAALLAKVALAELPLSRVDDARAVTDLHRRAADGLGRASADLWSSDQRGFAGKRVLPRTLGTVIWGRKP